MIVAVVAASLTMNLPKQVVIMAHTLPGAGPGLEIDKIDGGIE